MAKARHTILLGLAIGAAAFADGPKLGVGEKLEDFQRRFSVAHPSTCRLNPQPVAGVDTLLATNEIGGGRFLTLIGVRAGIVADYLNLAIDGGPDATNCDISCLIREVTFRCPATDAAPRRQFRFFWNGKSLTLIQRTGPNPTETAVRAIFNRMHQNSADTCDTIRAIPHVDEPSYSGPERVHAELQKSVKEAAKLARAKQPMEAAIHLAAAFTTTSRMLCCAGWLACPPRDMTEPAGWIAARTSGRNPSSLYLVAYPIPGSQFLDALADYGDDLEAAGEHLKAVEVFRLILGADPEKISAHLSLADALWSTGDRRSSAAEYTLYADLMAKSGHGRKLPPRIKARTTNVP
jgi:hypothetical protein